MYCSHCGTRLGDGASFCPQCGQPLAGAAATSPAGESVHASFWLRVGAYLIDQFVLGAVAMAGFMMFGIGVLGITLAAEDRPEFGAPLVFAFLELLALMIVVPWLYNAILESSPRQATLGKMACGIKVTDLQGERISFGRATGRHFAQWITDMSWLIGYLMVAFTKKRQSLHDMIAETVVVGAMVEPARVVSAPPARRMSGWGIATIVAAIVIIPVGIFTAIGFVAWREYSLRCEVAEGLSLGSRYKQGVEDYVKANGRWPADLADIRSAPALQRRVAGSRFVESIEIWDGTIVIAYGRDAHRTIRDRLVSLRPYRLADGSIVWQCGNSSAAGGLAVDALDLDPGMAESSIGITSLVDRELPRDCRMHAPDPSALTWDGTARRSDTLPLDSQEVQVGRIDD